MARRTNNDMRKIYLILAIAGIMMTTACSNESNEPAAEGNVMTEYEERFSALGNPICRLVATPPRQ